MVKKTLRVLRDVPFSLDEIFREGDRPIHVYPYGTSQEIEHLLRQHSTVRISDVEIGYGMKFLESKKYLVKVDEEDLYAHQIILHSSNGGHKREIRKLSLVALDEYRLTGMAFTRDNLERFLTRILKRKPANLHDVVYGRHWIFVADVLFLEHVGDGRYIRKTIREANFDFFDKDLDVRDVIPKSDIDNIGKIRLLRVINIHYEDYNADS